MEHEDHDSINFLSFQSTLSKRRSLSFKICLGGFCHDNTHVEPMPLAFSSNVVIPKVTERQVLHAFSRINKTATGPDDIPYWVWRDRAEILASKESVESIALKSYLPMSWKINCAVL